MAIQLYHNKPVDGSFAVAGTMDTNEIVNKYEEGLINLTWGYGRFVFHPAVRELSQRFQSGHEFVYLTQSAESARYLRDSYMPQEFRHFVNIRQGKGKYESFGILETSQEGANNLVRLAVRNTGYLISSRKAHRILNDIEPSIDPVDMQGKLAEALASLEKGSNPKSAYFSSWGMDGVAGVSQAIVRKYRPGIIVIGEPYLDSDQFLGNLPRRLEEQGPERIRIAVSHVYRDLEKAINQKTGMIFVETMLNPLLEVPDLKFISDIAHKYGVVVVADNTLATPAMMSPFAHGADIITHSLTKALNGYNDAHGGVAFVNPNTSIKGLDGLVAAQYERAQNPMDPEDQAVVLRHLKDFPERIERMALNTQSFVEYLQEGRDVGQIFHPSVGAPLPHIGDLMPEGWGHLVSFVLAGPRNRQAQEERLTKWYDAFPGLKAPGLGGKDTMLCQLVKLVYYRETDDELNQRGLPRDLIRVSLGAEENFDTVREKFDTAFAALW